MKKLLILTSLFYYASSTALCLDPGVAHLHEVFHKLAEAQLQGMDVVTELGDFGEVDLQRPWGGYIVLADAPTFKAKLLIVDPGQRLSLQSHNHRSEIWIVVDGEIEATVGDSITTKTYGDIIFVPVGEKHRITNASEQQARIAEIQIGESFEEHDIIRYEDDYGRTDT